MSELAYQLNAAIDQFIKWTKFVTLIINLCAASGARRGRAKRREARLASQANPDPCGFSSKWRMSPLLPFNRSRDPQNRTPAHIKPQKEISHYNLNLRSWIFHLVLHFSRRSRKMRGGGFDRAKNHKRQRRKRQSVTAKPQFV